MAYVTREQINSAKQIDLLTYLQTVEPDELVKESPHQYRTRTHSSLKLTNGLWHQWSTGIGGRSALDYLIKIRGMSFTDAVTQINERMGLTPSSFYSAPKPIDRGVFSLPQRSDSNDLAIKYLTGRGIDREIVLELMRAGRIYQERKFGNVVFVGIDGDGVPRHAAIRSTSGERLLIDKKGSDKRFSFSLLSDKADELHVFEGAIDALSFLTLEKMKGRNWHDYSILSLSGVSATRLTELPYPLQQYIYDHPGKGKFFLHLDNDAAGIKASEAIRSNMPPEMECVDMPPPVGKDYNDYLISKIRAKERNDTR